MTSKEVKDTIKYLRSLYEESFQGMSAEDWWEMLSTWQRGVGSESFKNVKAAINSYANKNKTKPPTLEDIYKELMNIDEDKYRGLFRTLCRQASLAVNPEEHITILDLGGFRWSEEHQRKVYYHAETRMGTTYLPQDFTSMPKELQVYAEDLDGLKAIYREAESNKELAYKRFKSRYPGIREELNGKD